MVIDAIVLAGGRSSRLGTVPKAALKYRDRTLLQIAIESVGFARRVAVVGDVSNSASPTVLITREDPPYSGPASGVAAGLFALAEGDAPHSEFTAVIACDMPLVVQVTAALNRTLAQGLDSDGLIAVDGGGHLQPLAAIYRTDRLSSAVAERKRLGSLEGLAMFRLIADLSLTMVEVPLGSTDDIDTWEDAARFEIPRPPMEETHD